MIQIVGRILFLVRTVAAIFALLLWCIAMPVLFMLLQTLRVQKAAQLPMLFHRGVCWIVGIDVRVAGQASEASPALFVANHISYLDIFAIGGSLRGHFIAKSEIANWPVLGKLARFQNTLFVERDARKANAQVQQMREYLDEGGRLILFPEGTSTMGDEVLPFKSSLFKAAEADNGKQGASHHMPIPIQPFAISYTHIAGKPLDAAQRSRFAWHDDTPLVTHFMRILGARTVTATLLFAEPVLIEDFESRKACASYCHKQVAELLASTL